MRAVGYWGYCPIGAQKGSKKGSKYGPKRGHFRAIFEPSWLSPYSPYWPVPLCTRPIYHRTQRDLSPLQSGTGQPGSGGPARLRTRYRTCTGALLSPYSPYWPVPLCTRPIYHRTQRDLSPVQSGTGQPGSGPGTGLRTRYRAQDPVQEPS